MELVLDMKIIDLNFGNIEGKEEFNNDDIEKLYLDIFDVKRVIEEKKYYIYGNKGTGKTSLLRYMDYILKKRNNKTLIILFKNVKQNINLYTSFKKLISQVDDIDFITQAFWQWFLLSVAVKENNINIDDTFLIFYANNNLFKRISTTFLRLINGLKAKYSRNGFTVEKDFSFNNSDNLSYLEEAGKSIEVLRKAIQENLKEDFYIFLDELETSIITSTYRVDAILIKNLITAANTLNEFNKYLNIIVAIRTEIINNIFAIGDEINKLLESKGIEIKWLYNNYDIRHPLIRMIIKKMRASMIKYSGNIQINEVSEEIIFKRWFPNQLLNELSKKKGDNAKILLHNTWLKPRDLVRLMNILKDKASDDKFFKRKHYDEAIKEYSIKAWQELKEELSASLNDKEISNIEKALSNFKIRFSYQELFKRLKSYFKEDEINDIINILYKIGIIGNSYKDYKNNVFKYYYRGDKFLDESKDIEIHRGLWKVFSLKPQKKEKIFNDSLKQQLKSLTKN